MRSNHELDLLSRQINQAHRAAVQNELNAAGLNEVNHPMLLFILQRNREEDEEGRCQAQRELAEMLHVSPAAVANSLKCLEKGGYIRREPGQRDARRNRVILTDKGAEAVDGCQAVFARVNDQMLEGFTEEEREQLLAFRRRMLHNLLEAKHQTEPIKEEE